MDELPITETALFFKGSTPATNSMPTAYRISKTKAQGSSRALVLLVCGVLAANAYRSKRAASNDLPSAYRGQVDAWSVAGDSHIGVDTETHVACVVMKGGCCFVS